MTKLLNRKYGMLLASVLVFVAFANVSAIPVQWNPASQDRLNKAQQELPDAQFHTILPDSDPALGTVSQKSAVAYIDTVGSLVPAVAADTYKAFSLVRMQELEYSNAATGAKVIVDIIEVNSSREALALMLMEKYRSESYLKGPGRYVNSKKNLAGIVRGPIYVKATWTGAVDLNAIDAFLMNKTDAWFKSKAATSAIYRYSNTPVEKKYLGSFKELRDVNNFKPRFIPGGVANKPKIFEFFPGAFGYNVDSANGTKGAYTAMFFHNGVLQNKVKANQITVNPEGQPVASFINQYENRFRYFKQPNGLLGIVGLHKGLVYSIYARTAAANDPNELKEKLEKLRTAGASN